VRDILQGKQVPRRISVDTLLITRDNVERIAPIF
jgi:hypothetical protein